MCGDMETDCYLPTSCGHLISTTTGTWEAFWQGQACRWSDFECPTISQGGYCCCHLPEAPERGWRGRAGVSDMAAIIGTDGLDLHTLSRRPGERDTCAGRMAPGSSPLQHWWYWRPDRKRQFCIPPPQALMGPACVMPSHCLSSTLSRGLGRLPLLPQRQLKQTLACSLTCLAGGTLPHQHKSPNKVQATSSGQHLQST